MIVFEATVTEAASNSCADAARWSAWLLAMGIALIA
jgi:hypothetical protein